MGLDMYLWLSKYSSGYKSEDEGHFYPEKLRDLERMVRDSGRGVAKVEDYQIGYWRKANAIHKYFVDKYGDGVDDCSRLYFEVEELARLRDICKTVSADISKAPELLPTEDGFFFGSTEYDTWYKKELSYTIELCNQVLDWYHKLPEEERGEYQLVYQASW